MHATLSPCLAPAPGNARGDACAQPTQQRGIGFRGRNSGRGNAIVARGSASNGASSATAAAPNAEAGFQPKAWPPWASSSSLQQGPWPASAIIHRLACIEPGASIGEGVVVGPHCLVGANVKLGAGSRLESGVTISGNTTVGERCVFRTGAVVGSDEPGTTVLGADNTIGHHAVVGIKCQDLKYACGPAFLSMGAGNDIREGVQIHRSSYAHLVTSVGDRNLIMGGCHVAHDCAVGSGNIIANNTLLAGHVTLGSHAVLGGAVAVKPFVRIGSYAFLAGGAMVEGDVPDCMRAKGDRAELQGVNTEGLLRNGFARDQIAAAQRACIALFGAGSFGLGAAGAAEAAVRAQTLLAQPGAANSRQGGDGAAPTPDGVAVAPHGGANGAAAGAPEAALGGGAHGMYRPAGTAGAGPADLLLAAVVASARRPRSPGPCQWRTGGKVADLQARVKQLEARLAAAGIPDVTPVDGFVPLDAED